jgi:uncharacterized small protein (DUF1192 family)
MRGLTAVAMPWLQIVRLVPSILDVSRELLKRTKRPPASEDGLVVDTPDELGPRIAALEENERRQAELVNQMAEQNAALARAVTTLHSRLIRLGIATGVVAAIAVLALVLVLSR